MSRFHPNQTVASVVAEAPRTSRVFERHGIDYCCGGKIPLADACAKKGLETDLVLHDLDAAVATTTSDHDWTTETISALVRHILDTHHTYVARELPRLTALMDKVNRVHGANHPEVIPPMAKTWFRVAAELEQHMMKEEQILFPMILAMDSGRAPSMHCGVEGPIRVMECEHEDAGTALQTMRRLANDYVPPADACGSWRALWSGLDEFEKDLHVHVHLENNVLFPRVRELTGSCA